MEYLVDRVLFAARLHFPERRHIFRHHHHLCSRQLLQRGIAFLVIPMRMSPEQDLNIGKLESQLLHRLLNCRHIPLIRAVDQDVSLRGYDQE